MNKTVLVGRLVKDPELKFLPNGGTAVCTFTIAVDRRFKKEGEQQADFIPIVVWGKQAENTANYMAKGRLIGISGRIQTRNYENKEGKKVYVTEVVADEVQFLDKGNGSQQSGQGSQNSGGSQGGSNFDDVTPVDDGDIPF